MNIKQVATPLYQAKGWMKFLAVMLIISGVVTAFSMVGLIIAWLPVWMGVLLFQAAGKVEESYANDDEESLTASLAKIKTFFVINGVLMLIYVICIIVAMLMFGRMAMMMGMHY